jgi:endonuclease-3 related protein
LIDVPERPVMIDAEKQRVLEDIFRRLLARFGPQHWWPAEDPFEMIAGAILTQSAAWTNVEKGILNLKQAAVLSPRALRECPHEELAALLHPCGYFNAKSVKLKAFAESCLPERLAPSVKSFSRCTG